MVEPTLPTLGATAGKQLLKKSVGDLYDYVKSRTSRQLRRWNSDRSISKAYSKLLTVRKVKTLWQVDKAVDLTSFYCPSHIAVHGHRDRINTLNDLDDLGNVLIEGIAGQGKSILLRYLSAVETARRGKIPVFIELRLIEPGETIKTHIAAFLSDLDIECDEELFDFLMGSGRIVLLLDAFDELDESIVLSIVKELEHLSTKYDKLKIIVTSRRNSDLKMSRCFEVVALSDLSGSEYEAVIRKLLDAELAEQLIARVRGHGGNIRGVLTTPLLVTLLVLIYKSYQEIPSQMSEFYDGLFQLLLQRHDGAKPGFRRKRRCTNMNDADYRRVFEAFCYHAKKVKPSDMHSQEVQSTAERAFADLGISGNAEDFVKDIVKITCLILEEGGEYRFIHKSVQEFYAASFLRRKPETVVRRFYPAIVRPPALFSWRHEIQFLKEIDTYRINKFAVLPSMLNLLGIPELALEGAMPGSSIENIRKWLGQIILTFNEQGRIQTVAGGPLNSPLTEEIFPRLPTPFGKFSIDPQNFLEKRMERTSASKDLLTWFAMSWEYAASKGVGTSELDNAAEVTASQMFASALVMLRDIKLEEEETSLDEMFS